LIFQGTAVIGRWEGILEGEGVCTGAIHAQIIQSLTGFGNAWPPSFLHPPQNGISFFHALEPFALTAKDFNVGRAKRESLEAFDIRPHRQVDDDVLSERADGRGVATFILQAPDKAR
jgi:hypothetical protein